MKKILFGIIATILFSVAANAQEDNTDVTRLPKGLTSTTIGNRRTITYHVNFGSGCWRGNGCGATVTIVFDKNYGTVTTPKYLFQCDKLEIDFEASPKLFTSTLTNAGVEIYLPAQKMVYNKDLKGYIVNMEFYK